MHPRKTALPLLVLFALPAGASAEPIQFRITPTGYWVEPGHPMISAAVFSTFEAGAFAVDPSTGRAAVVGPLVDYSIGRLPLPGPDDLGPQDAAFWNNSGNFRLDFTLTDVASGQSAELSMWGRAHTQANYLGGQWVSGGVTYWFGDHTEYATVGGKDYVLYGQQRFTGERPELSVWVGPNPPYPWVPEPGTFALAALGLAPLGLRRLKRR